MTELTEVAETDSVSIQSGSFPPKASVKLRAQVLMLAGHATEPKSNLEMVLSHNDWKAKGPDAGGGM